MIGRATRVNLRYYIGQCLMISTRLFFLGQCSDKYKWIHIMQHLLPRLLTQPDNYCLPSVCLFGSDSCVISNIFPDSNLECFVAHATRDGSVIQFQNYVSAISVYATPSSPWVCISPWCWHRGVDCWTSKLISLLHLCSRSRFRVLNSTI
jgi:hypothetical protein